MRLIDSDELAPHQSGEGKPGSVCLGHETSMFGVRAKPEDGQMYVGFGKN